MSTMPTAGIKSTRAELNPRHRAPPRCRTPHYLAIVLLLQDVAGLPDLAFELPVSPTLHSPLPSSIFPHSHCSKLGYSSARMRPLTRSLQPSVPSVCAPPLHVLPRAVRMHDRCTYSELLLPSMLCCCSDAAVAAPRLLLLASTAALLLPRHCVAVARQLLCPAVFACR
ncbi:hypothetical protein ZWY2020_058570 [Hordeum vulgare]|nr:hypothetical protein ZWY2020_058570 [Hordeum vulgare]